MKRMILVLLCAIMVFQAGCTQPSEVSEEEMIRPIRFYYAAVGEEQYSRESGALNWELRDLGAKLLTTDEVLARYLQGPVSDDLENPFPKQAVVEAVSLEQGLLTLRVGTEIGRLTGVRQTLAAACLVYTMTQLEGVEAVWLDNGGTQQGNWNQVLTVESFMLQDDTAEEKEQIVTLYFANAGCRLLVPEARVCSRVAGNKLPEFLVEQLLLGPQKEGGYAVLPLQTSLLGIETEDGVCTVNFSEEFMDKTPQTHREARMAVFSLVNTLTELDTISEVRILCNGVPVTEYAGLSMEEPFRRDERVIEAEEKAESFDATLYLPCGEATRLMSVPVSVMEKSGEEVWKDLLQALIVYQANNGYRNPIPEGTQISEITLENGICNVTFNREFAEVDRDPKQAEQAVRAVVCTLCSLRDVEQVKLMIRNAGLTTVDLSRPMTADPAWYMQ